MSDEEFIEREIEELLKENNKEDEKESQGIPELLPILPLRNTVVFPEQVIPLMVGRKRSIRLVDEAYEKDMQIGLIAQKDGKIENPTPDDLYNYGTTANILKIFKMPDGNQHVVVQGKSRFQTMTYTREDPYLEAMVRPLKEIYEMNLEIEALMLNLRNHFQRAVELAPYLSQEQGLLINNLKEPERLADAIVSHLNISVEEKQEIFEILDVKKRLEKINVSLTKEVQVLELGDKIQAEVQGEIDRSQRDFYLREQLKAIRRELGEDDDHTIETEELRERIEKSEMPEDVEKVARKELDRLSKMHPSAAEYTVSRTYLDWLLDMPWNKSTEDNLDVKAAKKVLDEDHYDLTKVKKRILEYLAVRQLKTDMRGPILCFAGPPGVGKTSLGRSIARALGREFIRISLGGIRDEAEIRGHRRTYIGALPGRIIQGIKKTSSNNPVFMLDEIDKVGADFRGDPSSALLEVLDPEQNFSFSDHYLEVPFDLSKVMFIATANVIHTIPAPLLDRMEVLELPGYTLQEKLKIAQKYLVPKQLDEHGLTEKHISFKDDSIREIISSYTREAGVRNLERQIASVCRGVAKEVVEGEKEKANIKVESLHKYLGTRKFYYDISERISRPGVVTGLAWTPTGGDILFIEATKMPGKGQLKLTGLLGDQMKESAQAALSYVRSQADKYDIPDDFFEKHDFHIHVPAGAIPKDGPSAGVTLYTALVSLFAERIAHKNVAMTGEVTLRGLVLPVGGIKDKVLAAHRAGIDTILIPTKNEKDLEEIPDEIREQMEFHFIKEMEDVVDLALHPN